MGLECQLIKEAWAGCGLNWTVLIRGDVSQKFKNIAILKIKFKTQLISSDKKKFKKIIVLETLEL